MARELKSSKQPRIVEKIAAACNLAEVSEDIAKRAKSLGCPAFKAGNRIDWLELKEWCAANTEKLKIAGERLSLRDQKLNEEIRKLKIANDEAEGLSVPISWMSDRDARLAALFKPMLYSKLVDEAPADMTNDVSTNRALLRNIADRLLLEIVSWQKESIIPKR